MTIFSDTDKSDINLRRLQGLANAAGNLDGFTVAVKQVILCNPHLMNQAFEKVFAKAGGMCDGQPDILIEMKHLDSLPVDIFRVSQRIEKNQLGGSCCDDDSGAPAIEDRAADSNGRLFGSRSTK